jgi:SpoIID/LytB domain protein
MKLRSLLCLFVVMCASAVITIRAQELVSPEEERVLEEEFIRSRMLHGESHASGSREDLGPVAPTATAKRSVVNIRVGIHYSFTSTGTYSEFTSLHHPFVQVSNTEGTGRVVDKATGEQIAVMTPGQIFDVRADGANYVVTGPGGAITVAGPVRFESDTSQNFFRIDSILKANILVSGSPGTKPLYRGAIEVSRGSSTLAGRVSLFNDIEVEDYVRGVVANESIASFHIEALKSQATAARGYAIANIGNYIARGYPFDIVDSSASQVYRGVISEHTRAILSTDESFGLVASYNGRIISALYSSSFGGHSDSNHWIFNSPSTQLPGTNITPYLTGIYDGEGSAPDLTDPAVQQQFWNSTATANAYDMCGRVNNRFARWRITIPASDIKARLAGRSVVISGDTTGSITGIEVLQRMTGSNRIARVRITLTTGVVEVRGWDNLRSVIGRSRSAGTSPGAPCGTTTIAANFTLTNPALIETVMNPDGTLQSLISTGGGWGHNVGMSQYGGHGRGLAGQSFLEILKTYYTGVDIGTYPVTLRADPNVGPTTLTQMFQLPGSTATLVVRPTPDVKRLIVRVNKTNEIVLNNKDLSDVVSVDISPYVVPGLNTVDYAIESSSGNATVNVNVQ